MHCAFSSLGQEEERYTVVVNLYQPISSSESQLLEEILVSQIEYYIIENTSWQDGKIIFPLSSRKMVSKLNELVKNDIQFYDYEALDDFKGLSETVKKKIENITAAEFNANLRGSLGQKQFTQNELNHQINELISIIKTELYVFGEKDVLVNSTEIYPNLTSQEKEELIKQIEEFKDGDLLSSISLSYTEIKAEDESGIFIGLPRKEDLADKILNMLAANAQRLERLESELIQIQIGGVSASPAVNYENDLKLLSQLPESMDFYFNSGSTWLSSGSLLQLNEIVEILAKAPSIKVVITGYADKTGAEQTNLKLSKKRAQAVKYFMKESGMSKDRFIINYYGASKSEGFSNEDRRVEIKFFI